MHRKSLLNLNLQPHDESLPFSSRTCIVCKQMMFRLVDANVNRAREALRVLEDIARFIHNDRSSASQLKTMRHALSEAFQPLAKELIRSRDVVGDTQREDRRARPQRNVAGLLAANFKRAQEALRSLEEAATVIRPSLHRRMMKLRFQVYQLERILARRQQLLGPLEHASLYVIIDPDLCRSSPAAVCRGVLRGGADIIQLRAPSISDRKLLRLAQELREVTAESIFIINDRPQIALSSRADGVHLGRTDIPLPRAREMLGDYAILGATTHNAAEARAAQRLGADYLSYGPVFRTPTKPTLRPVGFSYLSEIKATGLPFFPIGGIDHQNIGELTGRGITRAVVCSAIIGARDPEAAARRIKRKLVSSRSLLSRRD